MTDTSEEKTVQDQLQGRFPYLAQHIRVARQRRIFADVPAANLAEVFDCAVRQMGFSMLCTITGLDLAESLGVIYHLARTSGVVLSLSTSVDRQAPVIESVTQYFPAADAYEREMVDLLGFEVRGLAPGQRYPLPDSWPKGQFPLRKDWQPSMLEKDEGKNA